MHTTLESLLRSSAQAAKDGRTAESWRIMHQYATQFWLEEPTEPLGEFYSLRAGAADCLGMADEAVHALQEMQSWAETHDPAVALIARAHLAYQSINGETQTVELPDAGAMLEELAQDLTEYANSEWDSTTAGKLVLASTTAYTVASNIEGAALAPQFAEFVRTFGTRAPSEADRQLWFAQEAWTQGQPEKARALAEEILQKFPDNAITRFEAYDMLAHFDLMECLANEDTYSESIAEHWETCAYIACELNAPLIALRRTELACRGFMACGKEERAYRLARTMLDEMEAAPISPAILELSAACAEAAYEIEDFSYALTLARGTAEWCEMNGDLDNAVQCYTVASLSSMYLGEPTVELQERRAAVLARLENYIAAAQAYFALAIDSNDIEYAHKGWDILRKDPAHPDYLWVVAEAHLTNATVFLNNRELEFTDKALDIAEDLVTALPDAEDLEVMLQELKQRRSEL
ncbi:hypothetical protein F8377_05960 [Corynebacterium zhongnanshanii]|uniref:Tetratricopeptide repeat protein n=1 Tax=Corynebacterium zhongnanshanii TaxID=2768834 RepID=A0ABQ6VD12_9CORY|nr:hypothetical protein [Corynebacterium zhongnanshanii]KAB3520789.1 hypothetical protein F8377_05960 [Corynebacterium zhongnanshanii]